MNNTHWKKLTNPDYLGAYDFEEGETRQLTIKAVRKEEVTGPGGMKDECIVAHFVEKSKPMVLNATNCKVIEKVYKTPFIEKWVGKTILIHVEKVKYKGEMVDGLRLIYDPSQALQSVKKPMIALKKNDGNWSTVLTFISSKKESGTAFDAIEKTLKSKYTISPGILNNLKEHYDQA